MRLRTYLFLVALVCASSTSSDVKAAASQPIGVIVASQNAHLDGTNAIQGTNFFGGEEFVTQEGGGMQLRVRECRIDLGAATNARFLPDSHPESLLLIQGSARYTCPKAAVLWLETPAGVVYGADGLPSSGMIVVNDAHNLTISAYGEPLILDNAGELHTINAGQSYRVAVSDDDSSAGGPPGKAFNGRRKKLVFWLIGGAAAAFAAGLIWSNDYESPYKPTLH